MTAQPLYTPQILRLAADLHQWPLLLQYDGYASRRASICGSEISVSVVLNDQRAIAQLGMDVVACAMGQASAAILAHNAIGSCRDDIASAAHAMQSILSTPDEQGGHWPQQKILSAAAQYSARHPAIMLVYDAVLAALEEALCALSTKTVFESR